MTPSPARLMVAVFGLWLILSLLQHYGRYVTATGGDPLPPDWSLSVAETIPVEGK